MTLILKTAVLTALILSTPALAQTTRPAPSSEAGSQSSNMGLPPDDNEHANNGVGTQGSLEENHGSASSTVLGVHGGQTPIATGSSQGVAKPAENEPAQVGGTQHTK